MLTRTAALELAKYNILVVGVGPGAVDTLLILSTMKNSGADGKIGCGHSAWAGWQSPKKSPAVVAFLASDGASYMTPQRCLLMEELCTKVRAYEHESTEEGKRLDRCPLQGKPLGVNGGLI